MFKLERFSDKETYQARSVGFSPITLRLLVSAGVALIAVAVFLAYRPSMTGGFILDDDRLVSDNDHIKASDGLHQFWCTAKADDYWPVTNSSLWIEWRLWGMHPTGYHVSNQILHIIEALLIWIILRKLSIPGAFLAAIIFAVHPVNVESVAWIAQRKNTMAMLFFLVSILWYLKANMPTASVGMAPVSVGMEPVSMVMAPARSQGGPWERETFSSFILHPSSFHFWYWLSLAAFVLAMLSKGSAVVLPALLLGIVWWLRPLTKLDLVRTGPFFLFAAALAIVNVWFQTHGSGEVLRPAGFLERVLGAGGVVWFYFDKALLPLNLDFVYPQWHIETGNPLWWLPLIAALAVTAVLWRYRASWSRPFLFAWGFFCVALAPVMGFADVGFMKSSLVADHYQHIAVIGLIALVSAGWSAWHCLARSGMRRAATAVAIGAAGAFMFLTWQQNHIYRDDVTLYQAALEKNPGFWMGHGNLANILGKADRLNDAIAHYEQALALNPKYFDAHNNLSVILTRIGRPEEAIEHSKQALLLNSNFAEPRYNLGNAYNAAGQHQEAIKLYEQALRMKPNYPEAMVNMGLALVAEGRSEEAIEYYRKALSLRPDYAAAHDDLGLELVKTGRPEEAIEHYTEALRIKPDFADAHENLGVALVQTGRIWEGINHYREALSLKPDFVDAHNNLALALVRIGHPEEAIKHYLYILRLKPDFIEAYFNLALLYAAMHKSSDAIATGRKALEIAKSKNQTALAKKIENWLNNYRASLSNRSK
ncbi:MAG: tetratricopeptide repeat protein [Thermoguttaceae bacterium]|jgi:tetratricopeptide (TPR) repeat protein